LAHFVRDRNGANVGTGRSGTILVVVSQVRSIQACGSRINIRDLAAES
jgi:hypothetical protein